MSKRVFDHWEVISWPFSCFWYFWYFHKFVNLRPGGVDFFKTQLARFFHGFLPIRLEKLTLPNSESPKNKPWASISCKVCVFFIEIWPKSKFGWNLNFVMVPIPATTAQSVWVLSKSKPPGILQRIKRIYRIKRKWGVGLQVRTSLPHAPVAKMTVVTQTHSNDIDHFDFSKISHSFKG